MATDKEFATYVLDQFRQLGELSLRPMFGEYGLYLDGKVMGFVCDNTVFLKITEAGQAILGPDAPADPVTLARNPISSWIASRHRCCQRSSRHMAALPLPKPKGNKTQSIKKPQSRQSKSD